MTGAHAVRGLPEGNDLGSEAPVVSTVAAVDGWGQCDDEDHGASDRREVRESSDGPSALVTRRGERRIGGRILAVLLMALIVLAAAGVGCLWWQNHQSAATDRARAQAAASAKTSTVALLSYEPDTAEQKLTAARDLLTGAFRDSYTSLTKDVVIPAALQRHVSAVANVPAVAVLSADTHHAVVMVFVDQTTIIGSGAPTATSSVVKVTLNRLGDRWLVSGFDPV